MAARPFIVVCCLIVTFVNQGGIDIMPFGAAHSSWHDVGIAENQANSTSLHGRSTIEPISPDEARLTFMIRNT